MCHIDRGLPAQTHIAPKVGIYILEELDGGVPFQEQVFRIGPYYGGHVHRWVQGVADLFDGYERLQQQGESRRQFEAMAPHDLNHDLQPAHHLAPGQDQGRLKGDVL
ncbi:MAG: hypothetical protein BWX80_02601 [Candidatus Hydrogenedentes bacterium ADurb.Bin101]|nr:MAG: hypothetical protein BWX80_02601 [Candidatus Hydrogenedentes bacterium ADurb.Bin101]